MFGPSRIFSQQNIGNGAVEWFFMAREGVFGPYSSRDISACRMKEFIEKCKATEDDGGRSQPAKVLSLETHQPTDGFIDPFKRKRGLEA